MAKQVSPPPPSHTISNPPNDPDISTAISSTQLTGPSSAQSQDNTDTTISEKLVPTPTNRLVSLLTNDTNVQIREAESLLKSLLQQKQQLDRQNMEVEYRIYNLEGSYLEDTVVGGNIICGFDGYSSGLSEKKRATRTGNGVDSSSRIFSNSSTTYKDSLVLAQQLKDAGYDLGAPVPPAPTSSSTPRGNKKHASSADSSIPSDPKSKPETSTSTPGVKKRKRADKSDTPQKQPLDT